MSRGLPEGICVSSWERGRDILLVRCVNHYWSHLQYNREYAYNRCKQYIMTCIMNVRKS